MTKLRTLSAAHRIAACALLSGALLCLALLLAHVPAQAAPAAQSTPRTTPRTTPRASVRPATATPAARPSATSVATSPLATPTRPPAAQPPAGASSPELIAAGIQAYLALGCSGCHTLPAAKAVGVFGPSHAGEATKATMHLAADDYAGSATTVAEYLRESILNPEAYVPEGYKLVKYRMPAFTFATEEQVQALVALLQAQQ